MARDPGPGRSAWVPAAGFAAAASLAILAMYLVHPVLGGHRLPIGPDGPVYTWWTRFAEHAGLGVAPGRAGVPGAAMVLGRILGTEPVQTVALLGPALAAACGLAAAALVEVSLGPDRVRSWAAAILTAAFAAYLAGGWLANLALVVLFLGALAVLGRAAASWRAVGAGAALLAAAGLAHRTFLVAAAAILGGIVLAHVPDALRRMRVGSRLTETSAARIALGTVAGVGAALAGFAALSGAPAPGDTSQDGFLRRLGLRDLLRDRHSERLAGDAGRASAHLVTGVGLGSIWARRRERRAHGARYLVALVCAWGALTVVGMPVLWLTDSGPAYRLIAFAFFLPLTAAAGLAIAAVRRWPWRVTAVVAGAVFVGGAMYGWYRQEPFVDARELRAADAVARAVEVLPDDTPIVVVVDTRELASAFWVTRYGNVLRMGLAPERIDDLRLAVGSPEDFLAGRATLTGDLEHRELSRDYLGPAVRSGSRAVVLVARAFNDVWFDRASDLGRVVAPGVVVLRGPAEPVKATGAGDPGLGPLPLVLLTLATVAALALAGGGWAAWGLPGGSRRAVLALAPSAGLALAILGPVAADGLGLGPSGGGTILAGLLSLLGYVAVATRREPGGFGD